MPRYHNRGEGPNTNLHYTRVISSWWVDLENLIATSHKHHQLSVYLRSQTFPVVKIDISTNSCRHLRHHLTGWVWVGLWHQVCTLCAHQHHISANKIETLPVPFWHELSAITPQSVSWIHIAGCSNKPIAKSFIIYKGMAKTNWALFYSLSQVNASVSTIYPVVNNKMLTDGKYWQG